jgi:hypothetical protein
LVAQIVAGWLTQAFVGLADRIVVGWLTQAFCCPASQTVAVLPV